MAQGNYESGFSLGYKASKPIGIEELGQRALSISEEVKNQEKIGKERQDAFDKARQEFKDKQIEENKSFIYEDQFVETGLEDFDAAGELLRKSVKDSFETNMFAYNSGAISENEAKRRNAVTVGNVKEMAGVYDKAKASLEIYEKLEDEGKGSAANDIKRQALEDFFKNFRVSPGEVGLDMYTVTVENGVKKVVKLPAKQFNDLFNFGQGVDLENDLKSIVKEVGSDTYIKGNTKIQSWLKDEGKLDQATTLRFDAIVEGYSDNQIIDAAKKLKTTSSGEISVEKLNNEDLLSRLKTEVKQGMIDTVKEELKLKQSSIPFIQKIDTPSSTESERQSASQSYEVYSNVRSLFNEDPEISNAALQNLQNSSDKIRQIFRSGKDKITVQYIDDKRPDTVISLPYSEEKGFNVEDAALSTTAEILSNSSENSLDISKKAQNRYNQKNGIDQKTFVPEFNDFGSASLRKGVDDLKVKGGDYDGFTLSELLDSDKPDKYEQSIITLFEENGLSTSDLLIRKEFPFFGDNFIEIDVLSNGEVLNTMVITENTSLPDKIKIIEDLAKAMKKGGFSEPENKQKGVLD